MVSLMTSPRLFIQPMADLSFFKIDSFLGLNLICFPFGGKKNILKVFI
jgi:hypothetical protein